MNVEHRPHSDADRMVQDMTGVPRWFEGHLCSKTGIIVVILRDPGQVGRSSTTAVLSKIDTLARQTPSGIFSPKLVPRGCARTPLRGVRTHSPNYIGQELRSIDDYSHRR
jgi:hypothetical protein